jgi:hypothetical protein
MPFDQMVKDLLLCGAGFAGCLFAYRAGRRSGERQAARKYAQGQLSAQKAYPYRAPEYDDGLTAAAEYELERERQRLAKQKQASKETQGPQDQKEG